MSEEKKIENIFKETVTGDVLKNALDFAEFLNANKMVHVAEKHEILYKGERVCYVDMFKDRNVWTVWTEGDYSNECNGFSIDERTKEIAWKYANKCGNCDGQSCNPGINKIIFGKEFSNICNGACVDIKFDNPDVEALSGLKRLLEMRKYIIDNQCA